MEKNCNSYNNIFVKDKNSNNEPSNILEYKELLINTKSNQLFSLKKKINEKRFSQTSTLNPNDLILGALKICEKVKSKEFSDSKNKMNKLDILEDTKLTARTNYINNKIEKSRIQIIEDFKDFLKSCNKNAFNILEKNLSQLNDIQNSYSKISNENEKLEYKISNINNDVRALKNKLLSYNDDIIKLKIKFRIFKKMMPFFEELINQYPKEDPQKLIKEYFENKNISLEQLKRLGALEEKYYEIFNDRKKVIEKDNEERERIQMRIDEEDNIFKEKKKIIEDELFLLQKQDENVQKTNVSRNKLEKLMIILYKNIKKYIPEQNYNDFIKKIKYNPIKNEELFDPSIFSNKLYIELLENCIINKSTECIDGKLLRITIVFANYLSRKYLSKNKNKKYRYAPVNTFRDLKSLIDNIKSDNYRLKGIIINLKQKQSDLKMKSKNLENLQNKRKMEYYELLKKLETAKKVQLKLLKSKNNNLKIFNTEEKNRIITPTNNIIKSPIKPKIKIENNNNDKNIKIINNNANNSNSKFFITNMDKILNKNKKRKKSLKICFSENNIKLNKNKDLFEAHENKNKYNNYKEILGHFRNVKNIKMSKNKDKLYKKNAFNSTGNIFSNIEKIVKEVLKQEDFKNNNKNNNIKKERLSIETYNDFPLSKEIKKQIKKEKSFKKDNNKRPYSNQISYEDNYKLVSNKILKSIDDMIFSIKGQKSNDLNNINNKTSSFNEIKNEERINDNNIINNKIENTKINEHIKIEDKSITINDENSESENISSISF